MIRAKPGKSIDLTAAPPATIAETANRDGVMAAESAIGSAEKRVIPDDETVTA
jgi:hypothetical protein